MQKSDFLELVAKERTRQIVEKGYTAKHDDEHADGSLADAGAAYGAQSKSFIFADEEIKNIVLKNFGYRMHGLYPFCPIFDSRKKHDKKMNLIIGASFFMAEYERIVRADKKDSRCRGCNYLLSKDGNTWCGLTGMPMDEYDTRCEQYCLPPFETSEDNPLLQSFMKSSTQ